MEILTDRDRLEYLSGEGTAADAKTIVHSRAERLRVAKLAEATERFQQMVNPSRCPDEMMLGEYHLDTLELEESFDVSQHVGQCRSCQTRLKKLAAIVAGTSMDHRLYLYAAAASTGSGVSMMRDMTASAPSTFTFRINEAEINLALRDGSDVSGESSLWGLLTGLDDETQYSAELHNEDKQEMVSTVVDMLGGFTFDKVSKGAYELVIRSNTISYVLRGITI